MNRSYRGARVYLNVYDLVEGNDWAYEWGFGAYHSGLQIGSVEYSFGGHESSFTGCYSCDPKTAPGVRFREQIDLGETSLSQREVESEIENLKSKFPGNSYNLFANNCNHYANILCQKILKKEIPTWVNRAAYWGGVFECLMPKDLQTTPESSELQKTPSFSAFSGNGIPLNSNENSNNNSSTPSELVVDKNRQRELLIQAAMKRNNRLQNEE